MHIGERKNTSQKEKKTTLKLEVKRWNKAKNPWDVLYFISQQRSVSPQSKISFSSNFTTFLLKSGQK